MTRVTIVGTGNHRYRVYPNWARLPSDASFGIVSQVDPGFRTAGLGWKR